MNDPLFLNDCLPDAAYVEDIGNYVEQFNDEQLRQLQTGTQSCEMTEHITV
ncbi:MAG: hypothetical protein ACXVKK_15110 [Flavisolibacter sp.]